MQDLWHDLRCAARQLLRRPGLTVAVVVTLALGIGATTAVFSVINGVLLKPLGYPEPEQLVRVSSSNPSRGWETIPVSYPDYLDWRSQSHSFVDMGIYTRRTLTLTGGEHPERVRMVAASASLLPVLGFGAKLGRTFGPKDDMPAPAHVVLLSHGFWQRRFGGDPGVMGRSVRLDGEPFEVIGVLPVEVERAWGSFDVWSPFAIDAARYPRGHYSFRVIARLRQGVTLEGAQTEMEGIAARLAQTYQESKGFSVVLEPVLLVTLGVAAKPALAVLAAAVMFVLLIACANVANLLLTRSAERRRELAMRAALGATAFRLARLALAETVVLGLLGGLLGVGLARAGVGVLVAGLHGTVGRTGEITVDWQVVAFALVLSLTTSVAVAAAAAGARSDLGDALRNSQRGASGGPSSQRRRSVLVAAEVAAALALLASAGVMVRSFLLLRDVDPGFDPSGLVSVRVSLPASSYPNAQRRVAFFEQVIERIRALPDVHAAAVSTVPLSGGYTGMGVTIEDLATAQDGEEPMAGRVIVTPGYFKATGIPLLEGRDFSAQDNAGAAGAVIVNQALARRFWPGDQAVGKRLKFDGRDTATPWLTVVGVVGDVRHITLDQGPDLETYLPIRQVDMESMCFVARMRSTPAVAIPSIREVIWGIDPALAVFETESMDELLVANTRTRSDMARLLAVFAGVALLLAAVGLYGVIAYGVAARTREIGVRMALGAGRGSILRMVVGQGLRPALVGAAVGVLGGLGVAQTLQGLVFGVAPADPTTFLVATGALVLVAAAACAIPALRASRIDPLAALRYE